MIITSLAALATALVYGLGGVLVISGSFQIGTLVAMITLLTRLYGPINQLSSLQGNALTALVSFDRIFELLDLKPLVIDGPSAFALPSRESNAGNAPYIDFDDVFFRYPDASEMSIPSLEAITRPSQESANRSWTLQQITFHVPSGHLTALVGPSGAGKTTVTQLLSRLYDPTSGSVRINGHDLREVTLGSLQDTIGVVTQDAHLFHDTIRGNLAYARPEATERELVQACKSAHVWELIRSLPDGLDTVVGDRGYRLSGGEKQRIALARLLIKAPPVVILDEATAHLDSESEAAIQLALQTVLSGRTSLVIAHRLSTIRNADQILVLDAGRVREQGTHDELLAAGSLYATLYHIQFAGQLTGESESRA